MDFFFLRPPSSRPARHLRERAAAYAGYAAILGFFLYIYFIAFPSEHYPHYSFLNLAGREQGVVALKILFAYFKVLLLPFTVTVLPPLYTPPAFPVHPLFLAFTILAVVFSFVGAWRAYPKNKVVPFAVLWFWLAYLPASNIILLPNPLAFRFMYFPSVGVFLLMGLGLSRLAAVLKRRVPSARLDILVPAAVIGVCASAALANNSFFKNDLSACREMVRNYPDASRPYWNLGLAFLDRGQFAVAAKYLDRYRRADPRNPFVIPPDKDPQFLYTRGRVEVDNPDAAIAYFRAALRLKPDYMFVWQDLAKAFLLKKDYRSAEEAALVAIRIDGKAPLSYVYAVHSAVELGHFADAGALLKKVEAFASDDENVRWVAAFFRERRRAKEAGR
jgi:tetratricopeptide (TPR) repeat protein